MHLATNYSILMRSRIINLCKFCQQSKESTFIIMSVAGPKGPPPIFEGPPPEDLAPIGRWLPSSMIGLTLFIANGYLMLREIRTRNTRKVNYESKNLLHSFIQITLPILRCILKFMNEKKKQLFFIFKELRERDGYDQNNKSYSNSSNIFYS